MMSEVHKAALSLGPQIEEAADEIESERRLPPRIVEGLKHAGVFGMSMPRTWQGSELSLAEQLRVVETLSYFDGSVGWCALVGSLGGFASSWLKDSAARELFRDVNAPCAGNLLFAGQAQRVHGGYLIAGRWPFNSGCQHADVFLFTCRIINAGGAAFVRPDGSQAMRVCYLPASKVRLLDTWYSTGLRGSGSHDAEVNDVFVPEAHTANFPVVPSHRSGPLYVHPGPAAYVFPAVALGIARHALDTFVSIANRREMTVAALGDQRVLLRMSPHAQVAISRAEGLVRSARSFVYEVADEIWVTLTREERLSPQLRASLVIAATNAHRSCVEAVDLMYKANGGSSVYTRGCSLDRCFRDIHTVNQHHFTSVAFDEKAGQVLLGLEPANQMF